MKIVIRTGAPAPLADAKWRDRSRNHRANLDPLNPSPLGVCCVVIPSVVSKSAFLLATLARWRFPAQAVRHNLAQPAKSGRRSHEARSAVAVVLFPPPRHISSTLFSNIPIQPLAPLLISQ